MLLARTIAFCMATAWGFASASRAAVDPAYLSEAPPEIVWSLSDEPDLAHKAAALREPTAIYEFVRNETEFFAYHGARSSSVNTFLGRRGNDVDLASVVIAMLRSQGVPARYAKGLVRIPATEAMNWLRVQNLGLAKSILRDQGIQSVSIAPDSTYLELEHVWVQALVAQGSYRGAGAAAQVDCQPEPVECVWLNLDPSFKLHEEKSPVDVVDVSGSVSFDYEAFYNALNAAYAQPDSIDRRDKNPLDIYEEQILDFLRTNQPGKTLEDLSVFGPLVRVNDQLLPGSLPYAVVDGSISTYASVDEHDATDTPIWSKYLRMKVRWAPGVSFEGPSVKLAELSTKRLTYTYEQGNPERMVTRLGGEEIWAPLEVGAFVINGATVGLGFPFELILELDGPPATEVGKDDVIISVSYPSLTVGGYFLVATGGETSNWSQVHRAARQLLEANEQYPTVADAGTGIVYVDTNGDAVAEPGTDTPLLEDSEAQDALTGGLLWVAQGLYYAKLRDASKRLGNLNHVISPLQGFVGVLSTVYEVERVDGTAFSVLPGGLLIDMKGVRLGGSWRIDQSDEYSNSQFELLGTVGSALEHEIWRELTGYDAISTTNGIQKALGVGHALLELKKTATEDTMPAAYSALGFSSTAPAGAIRSTWDMFGHRYVTWRTNSGTVDFEVMKEVVDPSTPSAYFTLWDVTAEPWSAAEDGTITPDELCSRVDNFENQMIASASFSWTDVWCGGSPYCGGGDCNETNALRQLEYCFHSVTAPEPPDTSGYFEFFDETNGFSPSGFAYREQPRTDLDQHSSGFVQRRRNDLYLATGGRYEFLLPSRKTSGDFSGGGSYRFQVYLSRLLGPDERLGRLGFKIVNDYFGAGGGYLNGDQALELSNGAVFDNEVLTDRSLVGITNNDRIRTPSTSDPISTVTGNMYLDVTDFTIRGRGLDYTFTRSYNSGPTEAGAGGQPLGSGWTHSYDMRLIANDFGQTPNEALPENRDGVPSSLTYVNERGGESLYGVSGTGPIASWTVTNPRGVFDTLDLSQGASQSYSLRFRNGVEYVFGHADLSVPAAAARLEAIRDPYGNELHMSYTKGRLTAISDNLGIAGRTGLSLAYDNGGRLQSIADWTGRTWRYAYTSPMENLAPVTVIDSSAGGAYSVTAADVDGDGDLDVLGAARNTDAVVWYENTASDATTWSPHAITQVADGAVWVHATDMDGDGDVDALVAASIGDALSWYENTQGDGSVWTTHPIAAGVGGPQSVYAADIDADGDLDALASLANEDTIAWYENVAGDGQSWVAHAITTSANGAIAAQAADMDSDGDLDAVVASFYDDTVAWYENTLGNGSHWTAHPISTEADGVQSVYPADLDGDGDLDVLAAWAVADRVVWHENTLGDGSAWTAHPIATASDGVVSVRAADMDGDGDLDALAAAWYADTIAWYENARGDGSLFLPRVLTQQADGAQSTYAADVDGDGDLDALAASQLGGSFSWYENADWKNWDTAVTLAAVTNPLLETTHYHYVPEPAWIVRFPPLLAALFGLSWWRNRRRRSRQRKGSSHRAVTVRRASALMLAAAPFVWGPAPPAAAAARPLLSEVIAPADRNLDGVGDLRVAYTYYENGKAFQNQNAFGQGETVDYDLYRKESRITDPRGFVGTHAYDTEGQLAKIREPDGGILLFEHTVEGLRYLKRDALGYATTYCYCTAGTLDGCPTDTGGNVTREQDALLQSTFYEYGPYDQLTQKTDRRGNVLQTSYYDVSDGNGKVEGKPESHFVVLGGVVRTLDTSTYYPDGNIRERVDYLDPEDQSPSSRQRVTDYFYDPSGFNLERVEISGTDIPSTIVREYTYDALGRRETETLYRQVSRTNLSKIPLTTTYEYDDLDRVTKVIDPRGHFRETRYDENGKVSEVIESFGRVITLESNTYDEADRRIQSKDVHGEATTYEYDEAGNRVAVTGPNGHTTRYEYDAMGRRTATIDANGHRSETTYDLAGHVIAKTDARGETTNYERNGLGWLVRQTDPLGFVTEFGYDANGNLKWLRDPNTVAWIAGARDLGAQSPNGFGVTIYHVYDELNRLISTWDAETDVTRFEYDLQGHRTRVTDAEGSTTVFVYDALGRVVRVIDPVIETPVDFQESYRYDEAGNRIAKTDRLGRVTRYTYDDLNRLERVDYLSDGRFEQYTYDLYGNLESVSNPDVTYTYGYDSAHRRTSKADGRFGSANRIDYSEFDRSGNLLTKIGYLGNTVRFQYDATNRLVSMTDSDSLQVSYHYDPAGNLLDRILSNGTQTQYAYDALGRLSGLTQKTASGSVVSSTTFDRDRAGHILAANALTGTTQYTYDATYRLLGAGSDTYSYDRAGNRLSWNGRSYSYSPRGNRLQRVADFSSSSASRTFEYDPQGNLRVERFASGEVRALYDYDQKNRIRFIQLGSAPTAPTDSFRYDPFGYRIEKLDSRGTRRYLLEGKHTEAVYDDQDRPRVQYLRGVVIDEIVNALVYDARGHPSSLTLHHDALRSVTAATSHTGDVVEQYRYDAFGHDPSLGTGQPTATSGDNLLRYTGREWDPDTGLYYYRARYYNPTIGRFLSEDPLGFEAGMNFYAYVENNPVNRNDPTGKFVLGVNVGGGLNIPVIGPVGPAGGAGVIVALDDNLDFIVVGTPEFGIGVGEGPSGFARGLVSFDSASKVNDLLDFGVSVSADIGPISGSITKPLKPDGSLSDVTFFELGVDLPTAGFDASATVGFGFRLAGGGDDSTSSAGAAPGIQGGAGLLPTFNSGASGGFVLYPSKPNLNQLSDVYRK